MDKLLLLTTLLLSLVSTATAQQSDWTEPLGGFFDDPANWRFGNVPTADSRIRFALDDSYTVTLRQDQTARGLLVEAGVVSLSSDSSTTRVLNLSGIPALNGASINRGATLRIGETQRAEIQSNVRLNVGGQGSGRVELLGPDASLHVTEPTLIGSLVNLLGGSGVVEVSGGAIANFSTLGIGSSDRSGANGFVQVASGGMLTAGSVNISDRNSSSDGEVLVARAIARHWVICDNSVEPTL